MAKVTLSVGKEVVSWSLSEKEGRLIRSMVAQMIAEWDQGEVAPAYKGERQ